MGSLANLFNLNLTTDLPSLHKLDGQYLCKLEIPAHSGRQTATQTFNNIIKNGTPYILTNIDNRGWQIMQFDRKQGTYTIDYWVGGTHYTSGWWSIEWEVAVSGKNITATVKTDDTGSNQSGCAKYSFPATSMEVAFIEMSEPV